MVRVMVVDDYDVTREDMVGILKECNGVEIVAETTDGMHAIRQAAAIKPDIAVVDVSVRRLEGLVAVNGIHSVLPECRLLVVTENHEDEYIVPIVKAGASGYLLKEKAATELDHAIRALSADQVYFGQRATRVLAEQLSQEAFN